MIKVFSTKNFNKCPKSGCVQKKPNGKWGVISGKTGEFWEADYDSEEDARAGLRAYFANKRFSANEKEAHDIRVLGYKVITVRELADVPKKVLLDETFNAKTAKEAMELAKKKYPTASELKAFGPDADAGYNTYKTRLTAPVYTIK